MAVSSVPEGVLDYSVPRRDLEHFSVFSSILRNTPTLRIDASHYNPSLYKALEILQQSKMTLKSLGAITSKVFIPPRFKRIYVDEEHGVPFLQGSHIPHFQPADVKYLSRTAHKKLERWIIEAGWILVTCSGTIGRVTLCPEEWDKWAASQHILRIVPNETECPAGYLSSFLASPLGHIQLTAQIYGAVVDELTEAQARNVVVPLPTTDEQREIMVVIDQNAKEAIGLKSKAVAMASYAMDRMQAIIDY